MIRRRFLQTAGLSLILPSLESLGGEQHLENAAKIKRLFLMTDGYGFHTPVFYPSATGANYPSNDVIKALDPLREHVSILGNLKHMSGHASQKWVATGSPAGPNHGDSLDQYVSRHVSDAVPLDSLLLSTRVSAAGGSYRNRVPVAMMYDPEEIFDYLFTKGDVKARRKQLDRKQSMLDLCLDQARSLSRNVSASDKQRLEEYYNSIRETEKIVKKDKSFLHQPAINPGIDKEDLVGQADGGNEAYFSYLRSHMRFVELAFKFDLTRVAYLWEHGQMHGATHHGNRAGPIASLTRYAKTTVETIASMLTSFKNTKMPGGGSLLDQTLFVWTAALGSAAGHSGKNTPAILAGGGLKHHGRYTHFKDMQQNTKLYLTVLQAMGIESASFNDSTKTLPI